MFSKISIINILLLSVVVLTMCNKIYYIENKKFLNWGDANLECKKIGMNLLTIRSKAELEYLKEYIKNEYGRVLPYWLGACRRDGQFEWTSGDGKINEFFWHEGEPNDKSGTENCIHTWEGDFDWNDNDCELKLPFICSLQLFFLNGLHRT